MSGEGNDRGGVKAPRTLFSLGRPGAKRPREGGESTATVESEGVVIDDTADEMEIQYACGACGALLPSGASFCGECGTPVAMEDDEYDTDGMLDELVGDEEDVAAVPGQEPRAEVALELEDDTADDNDAEATVAGAAAAASVAGGPILDSQRGPTGEAGAVASPSDVADTDAGDAPTDVVAEVQPDNGQFAPARGQTSGSQTDNGQDVGTGQDPFDPGKTTELRAPLDLSGGEALPPESPPAEPAAVLYADPSMAEPLPPKAEGSWSVSEPMVGNAHGELQQEGAPADVAPESDRPTIGPAGAAVAGGVVGAAGVAAADAATTDLSSGLAPSPAADAAPTSWTVAPETPAPDEVNVPPGLVGTTAQAMPYGAGPVESSESGNKVLLIVAVAVVAILVLGGIAFALTRGGGSDVATNEVSTTTATTAKKADPAKPADASTTASTAATSSTTATTASTETTTPASTDSSAPASTDTTASTTPTTQRTTPTTGATTPSTPAGNNGGGQTPQTTTVAPAQINFSGQPSYRIGKGGSANFTVSNTGGSAGDFQCSGNGIQVSPGSGSLNPGGQQNIVIQDFRNAGAKFTISCVGAGGGRYGAEVVVD